MKKFGSELSDRALADMADLPIPMAITWYVQPMDKSKAINYVRTRSAWIDKEIIEEQRSAVNKGYDFSILPQELKYSKEETEDVLDHLQNKNQRLYVFTGLVYTYAESKGRATVSFKKDEPVPIWTGKKDDAEHPYQRYEVKATDLTHALKVAQDSYKAEKAAERAAAKDGVSLAGEARDMETGKDALAGDDPAKSTKSRTGQDIAQ